MIPNYKSVHNQFKLNGQHYNFNTLKELANGFVNEDEAYKNEIGLFLLEWLDDSDAVTVKTSGSTGKPKSIALRKQAMVNSAIATGDFFCLKPGDTAILCLPISYIAGKMMLVRAMILGLDLDVISPNSNPLQFVTKYYDFAAMVPMQLSNSIDKLNSLGILIIGGAKVSENIIDKFQNCSTQIYETYGMTETITHIAVKKLNNHSSVISSAIERTYFKTLPNIAISQDDRDCLVIQAPKLSHDKIVTNDVVKLHSVSEFEWLGRYDNVINSGGLKLFPEQIEQKLASQINQRFIIGSEPDLVLGDRLILVLEGNNLIDLQKLTKLSKLELPKKTYTIPKFIETSSGKVQRQKTLALLK